MGSPPGSSEIITPRPSARARKLNSIDPDLRLDIAANSPESETHLAFVNERSLTESEDSTLRLVPAGPSPGMGRILFSGPHRLKRSFAFNYHWGLGTNRAGLEFSPEVVGR